MSRFCIDLPRFYIGCSGTSNRHQRPSDRTHALQLRCRRYIFHGRRSFSCARRTVFGGRTGSHTDFGGHTDFDGRTGSHIDFGGRTDFNGRTGCHSTTDQQACSVPLCERGFLLSASTSGHPCRGINASSTSGRPHCGINASSTSGRRRCGINKSGRDGDDDRRRSGRSGRN